MQRIGKVIIEGVRCRVGSLEIAAYKKDDMDYVRCRVGSVETKREAFLSTLSLPNARALLSGIINANFGNSTTCVAYRVVWLVGARKRRGRSVRIVRLIPVASRKTFRKCPKPVFSRHSPRKRGSMCPLSTKVFGCPPARA